MYHELCARKNAVFNIAANARHQKYRKLLQSGLGRRATQEAWPLLEAEVSVLLHDLLNEPDKYKAHIRRNAAAIILKLAFGYTVSTEDDFFVNAAEEAARISGYAMSPGRWLVDYFPILKYIPSWLPGSKFKRQAEIWRLKLDALSGTPHQWVKDQMASGCYVGSFTSFLLKPGSSGLPNAEEEDIVKWCAGGLYAGASDTTVSALISFFMLMALYPDVQTRAFNEIEQFTASGNLPNPPELDRLVYLNAVLKETLRFAPVAPLALPHKASRDDEYEGYRIPKDTTIIANVWALMNDPIDYSRPSTFDPTRFLAPRSQPDPRKLAFGFGRRACPGSFFAETSMLFTMASVLIRFNISLPEGSSPPPKVEFTTGITSHIKPFDISITPRKNISEHSLAG